eukprot:TRINITY_DN105017_c0_g1_i1.p1 TRINITY_DN105017_c0_g1~~TRINITY_DN105017_c0_g1_i1.p1  ORF type:complete len:147 (-),score=13.75 TRINITY_DN105017_c0_g1_i1:69-509(-)
MTSLQQLPVAGPTSCHQDVAHSLAPPALELEQVIELQDCLIDAYAKVDFQKKLEDVLREAGHDWAKQAYARQLLCLEVQAPLLGRFGFEPSALGVVQSEDAFLPYLSNSEVTSRNRRLTELLNPAPFPSTWKPPEVRRTISDDHST